MRKQKSKTFPLPREILYSFELAERLSDVEQRRAGLTFVIVEARADRVELSGAIAEIARQFLKNDFRSIKPEEAQAISEIRAAREIKPEPVNVLR